MKVAVKRDARWEGEHRREGSKERRLRDEVREETEGKGVKAGYFSTVQEDLEAWYLTAGLCIYNY